MENHRNFSLLAPEGSNGYFSINEGTANDLSINFLVENLTVGDEEQRIIRRLLLDMPIDKEIIQYRQAVYKDLKLVPEMCKQLLEVFDEMKFYTGDRGRTVDGKSSVWELVHRLKELENYSSSIIRMKELTTGNTFRSEGMKRFVGYIDEIYSSSGFHELSQDMERLGADMSAIKSMTLGVNFNSEFYPEEVGILSLNEYRFTEQSILEQFIRTHRKRNPEDTDLKGFSMITHSQKSADESPLMNNLASIIERMLPSVTTKLKRALKRYTDISGLALMQLADEFLFYVRFMELEEKLMNAGLPCSMLPSSEENTLVEDFYNVKLAICRLKGMIANDIVCNQLEFAPAKNVLILTGPNRGGKTIFTQGIGLAFLLFQHGVFAPCSSGQMRICDGIYTHFPADENRTVSLGRLGEEAERFRQICQRATAESLLLFNESFATTSHTESLYIAKDVLKYLCCLGARTCFNTHMHELAEHAEELCMESKAVCGAVSVVMGSGDNKRSYKIRYEKPDSKSYAHDIACQYGITFEQLCKNMENIADNH